jgi:hypothetical protein
VEGCDPHKAPLSVQVQKWSNDMKFVLILAVLVTLLLSFSPDGRTSEANGHILYDPTDEINYCVGTPIDCNFNGDAEDKDDSTPTTQGPGGQ